MDSRILAAIAAACLIIGGIAGYNAGASAGPPVTPPAGTEPPKEAVGVAADIIDFFNSLTASQRNCIDSSIGEQAAKDLASASRMWPSPEEFEKIKSCTGIELWPPGGFSSLPPAYEEYTWEPDWEANKR